MTKNKYRDPEWIEEKMFGEEFDSPIIYYLVDTSEQFVQYSGTLEDCKYLQEQHQHRLQLVDYSALTDKMKSTLQDPF